MARDSTDPSVRRDTLRLTVGLDSIDYEEVAKHGTIWFDNVAHSMLTKLDALGVLANDSHDRLPSSAAFIDLFDEYPAFRAFGWVTGLDNPSLGPRVFITGCEIAATDSLPSGEKSSVDGPEYLSLKQAVWKRFSDANRLELTPDLVHVDYCFSPTTVDIDRETPPA